MIKFTPCFDKNYKGLTKGSEIKISQQINELIVSLNHKY